MLNHLVLWKYKIIRPNGIQIEGFRRWEEHDLAGLKEHVSKMMNVRLDQSNFVFFRQGPEFAEDGLRTGRQIWDVVETAANRTNIPKVHILAKQPLSEDEQKQALGYSASKDKPYDPAPRQLPTPVVKTMGTSSSVYMPPVRSEPVVSALTKAGVKSETYPKYTKSVLH